MRELAALVELSTYHFVRMFRRAVGQTPHRYITSVRIDQARRQLERDDLTVSQIAYRTGFANPAHPASTFRRYIGVSPTDYRDAVALYPRPRSASRDGM